jgi:hypothetical protein
MYIMAFLAALKLRKNVIFYGNKDFYSYLKLIVRYGISFEKMAGKRIKVLFKPDEEIESLDDNYAIIGTYNDLGPFYNENKDAYGIITAKTFFNPLKGQLNSRNIPFASVENIPELQGYGHGFFGRLRIFEQYFDSPHIYPDPLPGICYGQFSRAGRMLGYEANQHNTAQ